MKLEIENSDDEVRKYLAKMYFIAGKSLISNSCSAA